MREWNWGVTALTTDTQVGNALAAAIAMTPADATMFDVAMPLRQIGAGGAATAWVIYCPLKQTGFDAVTEFMSAGPYPLLNSKGLTDQQIAAAKAVVFVDTGVREAVEDNVYAFVAANGYEAVPPGE